MRICADGGRRAIATGCGGNVSRTVAALIMIDEITDCSQFIVGDSLFALARSAS